MDISFQGKCQNSYILFYIKRKYIYRKLICMQNQNIQRKKNKPRNLNIECNNIFVIFQNINSLNKLRQILLIR